jgi:SAM-dependent methyltransferase
MKKLNFGCGPDIKSGWDNCDIQPYNGVINFDADKFPYPFRNDIYDYILVKEVLFYLDNPQKVLNELRRISKNNAIIEIEVPYYNNKGAQNDMLARHYFSDSTFKILVDQPYAINKVRHFKIISSVLVPTKVGKFLPESLRNRLSLFVGGLIAVINIKLKVIKNKSK